MLRVHVVAPKGKKPRLRYVWRVRQAKENTLIKKLGKNVNKISAIIIGILIIGGVGWLVISNQNAPEESNHQAQPERAPGFALQNYNGKTMRLADFAGRPLVINAWAAWCPFCVKELPALAAVQKEFVDKVVIIAINRQESLSTAKGYTDQHGLSNDLIFLLDPSDSFYQSIGGFSMPETIFVDKNGNIADHKRGPMDAQEMRERIRKTLN